jgi:DNA-binding response OmpR family regulator
MTSLILIVDDDDTWRNLLVRSLRGAGYEVVEAEEGRAGLRVCRDRRPALLITDVFMPEQDGLEILQELRDAEHRPKILAISGSNTGGQVDYLGVASKLGADKVLRKPFELTVLLEAVEALIGSAREASA